MEILRKLTAWKEQIEKDIINGCLLTGQEVLENVRNEIQSLIWNIESNNRGVWYTESWNIIDILGTMEDAGVEPTEENIQKVTVLCREAFSDVSDRNECLRMIVEENCK